MVAAVTFGSPVNYQISLAGNFGEPRPNHFHGGIDVRTEMSEGKPIFSVAEGYVSRITVGLDGFGNAVYVTHPCGITTVYCHLKKFIGEMCPKSERKFTVKQKCMTIAKKIYIYCIGLFVMALGVSFSGMADLGMSPVNSIPYVLSEIFTSLSMGTWILIIFSLYILIQFIILGKRIQPARALQLICTTMFGYFTDFTNYLASRFLPDPDGFSFSPVLQQCSAWTMWFETECSV